MVQMLVKWWMVSYYTRTKLLLNSRTIANANKKADIKFLSCQKNIVVNG